MDVICNSNVGALRILEAVVICSNKTDAPKTLEELATCTRKPGAWRAQVVVARHKHKACRQQC